MKRESGKTQRCTGTRGQVPGRPRGSHRPRPRARLVTAARYPTARSGLAPLPAVLAPRLTVLLPVFLLQVLFHYLSSLPQLGYTHCPLLADSMPTWHPPPPRHTFAQTKLTGPGLSGPILFKCSWISSDSTDSTQLSLFSLLSSFVLLRSKFLQAEPYCYLCSMTISCQVSWTFST